MFEIQIAYTLYEI